MSNNPLTPAERQKNNMRWHQWVCSHIRNWLRRRLYWLSGKLPNRQVESLTIEKTSLLADLRQLRMAYNKLIPVLPRPNLEYYKRAVSPTPQPYCTLYLTIRTVAGFLEYHIDGGLRPEYREELCERTVTYWTTEVRRELRQKLGLPKLRQDPLDAGGEAR